MYLKSIEIQGFKSFPDRTVIALDRGLTAIVGPNGSGKSNIADAVRWVLGEQSSKTLRGTRMEDVIFAGTQSRGPVTSASVTLLLDNGDHTLPIEADEVPLTRRYYRSGESEYLIGKNVVRLRDIHELLMDTGLGRDGYAIISQGKIAEVVGQKSEERRQIFEEAAGISKYRYRRAEAIKNLAAAEDNLTRLRDILGELEGRLEPLREGAERAQKFLKLSDRKKVIEVSLWHESLRQGAEQLRGFEHKIFVAEREHKGLDEKIEAEEKRLESLYSEISGASARIDERRREQSVLREGLAATASQVAVMHNDIAHAEAATLERERELAVAATAGAEIEARIAEKRQGIAAIRAGIDEKAGRVAALTDRLTAAAREDDGLRERASDLTAELGELSRQSSDLQVQIHGDLSAKTEIAARIAAIDERTASLRATAESAEREITELARECGELEDRIQENRNALEGIKLKRDMRKAKADGAAEALRADEARLAELAARIRALQQLENAMEGFSGSVKAVLAEGGSGRLRGIHGVVGKLIEVDSRYSVAVETALGAALQHIVVDSEQTAKNCIAFLQRQKAGRATFLPITSVRSGRVLQGSFDSHDGFIGVAANLVTAAPQYRGIVENLLSMTAVVDDIDTAVALAKQNGYRFRVVTLDGQVVNAGGSLTGGSLIKSAGLLGRAAQIAKLRDDHAALGAQVEQKRAAAQALQGELDLLDADIRDLSEEIAAFSQNKLQSDLALRHRREALETGAREIESQDAAKQSLAARLLALSDNVAAAEGSYRNKAAEIEYITAQLSEISARAREAAAALAAQTDEISALRLEMQAAEREIQTVEEEISFYHAQQGESQARAAEIAAGREEAQRAIDALRQGIAALQEGAAEGERGIAAIEAGIAAIIEGRTEAERRTTEIRAAVRDVTAERERLAAELVRLGERRTALAAEQDQIVARLWDEYEITRSEAADIATALADLPAARRELAEMRGAIKALGSVNVSAIEEYKEVSQRHAFLSAQVADIEQSRDKLLQLIEDLTGEMRKLFTGSFNRINAAFQKVFAELFGGGTASLSLAPGEDVLEAGIEISVTPPGKKIQNLLSLSGGEQALVAIAIYFAILRVRPAPFCVLDEIEAALDDVNVYKYAAYLRRMNRHTQFISITHRRGTMEESDILYGVTMQQSGISKLLALDMREAERSLQLEGAKV